MLKRVFRRCTRAPLTCIAVILFVATLSVILCFLQKSQEEELQHLKDTYYATPVTFTITWLDGTRLNDSSPASGHFADLMPGLFLGNGRYTSEMKDMVTDLQIRMWNFGYDPRPQEEQEADKDELTSVWEKRSWEMVGITTPEAAKDQPSDFGSLITWEEGYDESILLTDEQVCIVPEQYIGPKDAEPGFVELNFSLRKDYICKFKIVGRYKEENYIMYCPYMTMENIYLRTNTPKEVECLSGRLANNDDLERFKEAAAKWFATPNPMGEPTPWDNPFGYKSYPLAVDIYDSQLVGLMKDMEKSMTVNRITSMLVFILSTGAGFLTGFLVIRSRKQEIALMRTLGTSNGSVCLEFGLEQLLCVVAGVLLGGSYALWQPLRQLCIFAGVYFVGLGVALLIFVRANLLATMKEDE